MRLDLPPFEDANSIQIALMQVVDALLDNRIDSKRAGLVLYALQTASSNLAGCPTHSRRSNEWVWSEPGLAACEVMLAEPTHPEQRDEWGTRFQIGKARVKICLSSCLRSLPWLTRALSRSCRPEGEGGTAVVQ